MLKQLTSRTPTELLRRAQRALGSSLYRDKFDITKTIFVAGSARSGTTWLCDIINYNNAHRLIFEPFRPDKVPSARLFPPRRYLRPGQRDGELASAARMILEGRVRSEWSDQYNRKLFCTSRIIKDIRCNLMLGWLRYEVPEMPLVMVIRHPCAVAASALQLGWDIDPVLFTKQQDLVEDFLGPYVAMIERSRDSLERAVLLWAIETFVPLRQLSKQEIHVVLYEQLVTHYEEEASQLFRFLGLAPSKMSPTVAAVPSVTSVDRTRVGKIDSWRSVLGPGDVKRALELIRPFHLDRIFDAEASPIPGGLEIFRKSWGMSN